MTSLTVIDSGVYAKGTIEISSFINELLSEDSTKDVGAIMTFIGIVRETGKDEKKITRLEMEAYEEHASIKIRRICDEIKEKYKLSLVRIYHFVGIFEIGEPLVFVLVAGKSRNQTYPALREAVERYKTEPAVFKKEVYIDGSHSWISGH